jgi:hypothetical protein
MGNTRLVFHFTSLGANPYKFFNGKVSKFEGNCETMLNVALSGVACKTSKLPDYWLTVRSSAVVEVR